MVEKTWDSELDFGFMYVLHGLLGRNDDDTNQSHLMSHFRLISSNTTTAAVTTVTFNSLSGSNQLHFEDSRHTAVKKRMDSEESMDKEMEQTFRF